MATATATASTNCLNLEPNQHVRCQQKRCKNTTTTRRTRRERKRRGKSKGICTHSGVSEQFAKAEADEGKQRAEIQKKKKRRKKTKLLIALQFYSH